jgi:hypothetical protein
LDGGPNDHGFTEDPGLAEHLVTLCY